MKNFDKIDWLLLVAFILSSLGAIVLIYEVIAIMFNYNNHPDRIPSILFMMFG